LLFLQTFMCVQRFASKWTLMVSITQKLDITYDCTNLFLETFDLLIEFHAKFFLEINYTSFSLYLMQKCLFEFLNFVTQLSDLQLLRHSSSRNLFFTTIIALIIVLIRLVKWGILIGVYQLCNSTTTTHISPLTYRSKFGRLKTFRI
jgi:hypothetical protein